MCVVYLGRQPGATIFHRERETFPRRRGDGNLLGCTVSDLRPYQYKNWSNMDGSFPPRFYEALLSLYNWGRNCEQPRIIQLSK